MHHSKIVWKKYGIELMDESYPTKCSALDQKDIQKQEEYKGDRIERGLFKTNDGSLINADLNAALNIVRKGKPKSVGVGVVVMWQSHRE